MHVTISSDSLGGDAEVGQEGGERDVGRGWGGRGFWRKRARQLLQTRLILPEFSRKQGSARLMGRF